jgi:hypothetical protein
MSKKINEIKIKVSLPGEFSENVISICTIISVCNANLNCSTSPEAIIFWQENITRLLKKLKNEL